MATHQLSRGALQPDNAISDLAFYPRREVLRIEALSDSQVLSELHEIMDGRNYSWHGINELLQVQLDTGVLEFTLAHGDVLFEWNNLCDEKRIWERERRFSVDCPEFNRDCLINLKLLPTQAGLGHEGKMTSRI